ncbi:MAG: gliding motility-associated C-terminal domain-containing protein [Bacteroidetes bacterium]|nr:gliding motility-associated C-terminal domain-containing protein [Bacteroidota bacterium]
MDSVLVGVGLYPVPDISADTTICVDGTVQLSASGGDAYFWTPADSLTCTLCHNPIANPVSSTIYYVTVRDTASGCEVMDSISILVENLAISPIFIDTLLNSGETVMLGVNLEVSGSYLYLWSPSDYLNDSTIANPISTPVRDVTYQVIVTDGVCSATASLIVRVNTELAVQIPSAFTPNGDGKNDDFYPVFLNNSGTVIHFRVYNRYGQLIHNSTTPWDGKFKGSEQPTGTFVYYMTIRLKNEEQQNYQGSVTLVR